MPGWSVGALDTHPDAISAIHSAYARAGATVHTANTFRTRPRTAGDRWAELARRAVELCRDAVPEVHRVAGSIAPIFDCYRPDLAPDDASQDHNRLARVLVDAGVDLLLCETFPCSREALQAVEAATSTGTETWLALTAGPDGRLMDPDELADAGRAAVECGASAVLVNCVAASRSLMYVEALAERIDCPVGVYANAGRPDERIGWAPGPPGPGRYVELARAWIDAGATLIGSCCGTGPEHIRALRDALDAPQ